MTVKMLVIGGAIIGEDGALLPVVADQSQPASLVPEPENE